MKIEFRLCQCGVKPAHGRLFQGEEKLRPCSPPFFSKESLRKWLKQIFSPLIPADTKGILLPRYLEFQQKTNDAPLTETDQEAWDSLPEEAKAPVRNFYHKGADSVDSQFWPGAFGQDPQRELVSLQGQNPPDDPNFKCNILRLYAPMDRPGTLK